MNWLKKYIQKDTAVPLTLSQYTLAGAFAGICISFVEGPIDLFKSQMQVRFKFSFVSFVNRFIKVQYGDGQKYTGVADCARKIVGQYPLAWWGYLLPA